MYIIFCEYMNNVGSTINTQCLLDFYSIIIMVLHIRPFDLQIFQLRVFEIHKKIQTNVPWFYNLMLEHGIQKLETFKFQPNFQILF